MSPPQYQRGVYTLPFRDAAGDAVAVAITADGRCIGHLPYRPASKDQAIRALWAVLASADPLPVRLTG
jgi:hypothetical protein